MPTGKLQKRGRIDHKIYFLIRFRVFELLNCIIFHSFIHPGKWGGRMRAGETIKGRQK